MTAKLCVTLALMGVAGAAFGEAFRLPATKLTAPPKIDGIVNAEEWKDAAPFSGLVDYERREPAPEKSEFWLAYDEKYIYFAARLEDKEPDKVTATERQTNASFMRDDHVGLSIGIGGYSSGSEYFQFNAIGTASLELSGGSAAKLEWQGQFEAAARKTATGWEGEARIPWQLLNLQRFKKGDVRFDVFRSIPRRTFGYTFGKQTPTHPEDQPIWEGVEPPKPQHDTTFHVLPYAYAGWDPDKGRLTNAGVDFKTELRGNIGIAGTINPDFRNIEQSVLPLSFSRFELLADETRPFFLEGGGYTSSMLFASQRIGDFDLGLNIHGPIGNRASFGLLNTLDLGRNRSTAGRFGYKLNDEMGLGMSFTSLDEPDHRNEAVSGEFYYSKGAFYSNATYARTSDQHMGEGTQLLASGGYFDQNLSVNLSLESVDEQFHPALGYIPEVNYKGGGIYVSYNQTLGKGAIQRWSTSANASSFVRQDGDFHSSSTGLSGGISLRNGISFRASTYRSRYLDDRDYSNSFGVSYPTFVSPFSISLSTSEARFAGSPYRSYNASLSYLIGSKYSVSASHQIQDYFGRRDQTVLGFSAKLAIDQELGLRFIERPEATNWYLTYRKSGGKGAEYFVIFGDPTSEEFRSALIIKGIFPIEIR